MKRLSRCTMVLTISLLIILPKKVAKACGFYIWPGEYRFWLLQPDLTNQNDLSPFFLSTGFYYRGFTPDDLRPYHYDQNVQEWQTLLGKNVSRQDIDTILYNTIPDVFLNDFSRLTKVNSFALALSRPQNKPFLQYMKLAKKVEVFASNPDPWEENAYPASGLDELIEETSRLYASIHAPAIRLRLAYQLVRLYGYNGEYRLAKKVYTEKIVPVRSGSWIKGAALYQLAKMAGGAEQDYLYSRVFDQSTYNRSHCLMYLRSADIKKILPFTANDHERIVLYAMKSFSNQGRNLHNLRYIYSKEPDYKEIVFLLLREINKVEDWLLTSRVTGFEPAAYSYWATDEEPDLVKNFKRDTLYTRELYEFVQLMIKEKKNKDSALLHICAAHLAFVRGDYQASQQYLSLAGRITGLPANVRTQVSVNDLLLHLETEPRLTVETENRLMHLLLMSDKKLGVYSADLLKDQLCLYAGRKLIRHGDRVKGLLLLGKTRRALGQLSIDTYKSVYEEMWEKATPADYDKILNTLEKTIKTPFEKFVTTGNLASPWDYQDWSSTFDSVGWNYNKILDLKAGWYIRQDSLEKALAVLKQIPPSLWKKDPYAYYLSGDPLLVDVYHPHRPDSLEKNYTKPQYIAKIIQLKAKAASDKKNAGLYYYQLGNMYYNMTYHGNYWLMSKPWWSGNDMSEYAHDLVSNEFNSIYYGCTRAKEYYLRALQQTTDKKLASLCCLMAGKCQENYQDYMSYLNKKEPDGKYNNPYVGLLTQKGMNRDYYKELVEECATYSSYIHQLMRL